MFGKQFFCALTLSALGAGFPLRADTITWLTADFPPLAMPADQYPQGGYMEALLQQVQQALPQYRFQEEAVPWPRALFLAQSGGAFCMSIAAHTPEREAYLRFTAPYGYVYPVGVVIRQQDQAAFNRFLNPQGELLLGPVLQQDQLKLGIAGSRSYGATIDALLKPQIDRKASPIQTIHQDNSTRSLVNMLQKKRFDYTLAYPGEAAFYAGKQGSLYFYPIAGNSELLPGRFSCTKSPQTDQAFDDLGKIASALRDHPALTASYEKSLPPYLIKPYRQRLLRQMAATP